MRPLALLAATLLAAPAAVADAGSELDALLAEYWTYYLREHPIAATAAGVDDYNDRLPRVTESDRQRRLAAEQRFLDRLRAIDRRALGTDGLVDADVFEWVLRDSIGAYELDLARIPFNTFYGFFMAALTASNGVLMDSVEDYSDYLERLRDIPRYFAENVANMRAGARDGFVLPKIVIEGVLPTVQAQVKDDPVESSFYDPFRDMHADIGEGARLRLQETARDVITNDVMPAFAMLASYLGQEYPASETIGATALPDGDAYYAFQIRRYTTLEDATADAIHEVGLAEVARIRGEMQAILEELEFDGDFAAFADFLRTDPQFYASSEDELLREAAWIAKRIDYRMPGFFGRLPRQPYGVVPVPSEIAPNYTAGAYFGAPLRGSHGGAFWINTHGLDERPLYELPALTLHEAVPGHHHQNALALEMQEAPAFRRDLYFSAYGEGWALYSEKLGVEMGIYRTPYEHFGRLSYEMWRACRLVIDTGIHAKGWTRQQAMEFLARNTSLSQANVRAEVDRYISWPGQALAYKLGELSIQSLRQEASSRLGDRFDLREFHDVVLGSGALPLAMLEALVERYIALAEGSG